MGFHGYRAAFAGMAAILLYVNGLIDSENASASFGPSCVSAQPYGRTENVGVISVVIAPFELGNVQREIFAADFVEATHSTAVQERPETIDCLSVDNRP